MGGNPDIFKMTIERKGKKVTLSGSEADVDAFWGLIRSHLSELDGACTNAQSTLAETPKEPLPGAQPVHTAPSICGAAPDKPAQKRRPNTARAQVSDSIGLTSGSAAKPVQFLHPAWPAHKNTIAFAYHILGGAEWKARGKLQFSHKRHELSGGKLRSKPRLLYAQEYAQPQRLSGFFR